MATIYRFIIEERQGGRSSGRTTDRGTKGAAKKGRNVSFFGGSKGGVEHNRKLRAINPLLNKATNGIWEQGMRVGRAAMGLIQVDKETGQLAGISSTAVAILVAYVFKLITQTQNQAIQRAKKENTQNYNQLENGFGAIHGAYEVTENWFDGRITYNQNK